MKNNETITEIQEMLLRELKRLDNDNYMAEKGSQEVARSNALTNSAMTYIKSVNLELRIFETKDKFKVSVK